MWKTGGSLHIQQKLPDLPNPKKRSVQKYSTRKTFKINSKGLSRYNHIILPKSLGQVNLLCVCDVNR